ncbi:MAG: hypothetical protein EON48_15155, partial [Acetobacteraceae bacterium]
MLVDVAGHRRDAREGSGEGDLDDHRGARPSAVPSPEVGPGGRGQAQTVIRIVASNGDRTATQTAISKLLAAGWTFNGINGFTSSGGALATATGANFGAWNGTYAGTPVVIKVSFSGALAGIAAVAG